MFPRNSSSGLVTSRRNHELWRQYKCAALGVPHVNPWPLLANPDGTYKSGLNYDTIHPNASAADMVADACIARMAAPWEKSEILELVDRAAGSAVMLANAVSFGGTGAALPANYFTSGSSGTPTYSVEAADANDFGNWLRTTFAGAAASATGWTGTARNLSDLGISAGDRILFTCRLRFTPGVVPTIQLQSATFSGNRDSPVYQERAGETPEDMYVVYETTVSGGTVLGVKVTATSTGPGYFEVNRPLVYNLTANGLA